MKNNKILKISAIIIAVIAFIIGSYWIYTSYIQKNGTEESGTDTYICPMHPQIVSDRPGSCPICGMDLVKKSQMTEEDMEMEQDHTNGSMNTVKLSPSQLVLANVQTSKVRTMVFQGEKVFNGYVKINEKKYSHIATAVSGKIVNMFVNFEGQYVSRGQKIAEIYSPELVATQKEFLLALNNLNQVKISGNLTAIEHAQSLLEAAKTRLLLWEMSQDQIDELERTQTVKNTIIQYSKYSGIVTKKYLNPGHWAMMGQDILEVVDLSTVWVMANVYESDVQYIKNGQSVEITSGAYPNEKFTAKINFVEPLFDAATRTMQVRIDVSNRNNWLKPDMYVRVKINTYAMQTTAVPKNAVIRTGERNVVYIEKSKGVFEPREVQIGYEQDGYYAVTLGLKEGETVVSTGGFLIDSETQIQEGLKGGHEGHDMNVNNEDKLKINPGQDIMKDMEKKHNN